MPWMILYRQNKMAESGKYSPQYTLRRKMLGEGGRGGGWSKWKLGIRKLRIRSCPMSIMAFELPIMEMDFALSEF